jgi:hypothetical protein
MEEICDERFIDYYCLVFGALALGYTDTKFYYRTAQEAGCTDRVGYFTVYEL